MCPIANGVMAGFLVWCSLWDLKKRCIPMMALVMMQCLAVIIVVLFGWDNLHLKVLGVLLGFFFLGISKWTREAIGYGDSWLILILGLQLGILKLLRLLLFASLLSGVVSLICLWAYKWKKTATIPFVPFLTIAYMGVVFV